MHAGVRVLIYHLRIEFGTVYQERMTSSAFTSPAALDRLFCVRIVGVVDPAIRGKPMSALAQLRPTGVSEPKTEVARDGAFLPFHSTTLDDAAGRFSVIRRYSLGLSHATTQEERRTSEHVNALLRSHGRGRSRLERRTDWSKRKQGWLVGAQRSATIGLELTMDAQADCLIIPTRRCASEVVA